MKIVGLGRPLGAMALAIVIFTAGLASAIPVGAASDTPAEPVAIVQDPGAGAISEHTCDGCEPPLGYQGGRVMDTTGAQGVTITPIFWAPDGYEFPDGYVELVEQYIADVAADSGTTTNVYSLVSEYSIPDGENQQDLRYQISSGDSITDTNPYPESGCDIEDDFTDCLTDDQLRDELDSLVQSEGLIADLANFYPVFFPEPVMTEDRDGSNSVDAYCGYHRAFETDAGVVAYGNEPFLPDGCGMGQSPNGNLPADGAINVLSHEVMEALTDPEDTVTWNDKSGHEIGDICAEFYGVPLGVADPDNPDTTGFNQEINGNRYYTQTEFSNAAFEAFGDGAGCQQSADTAAAAVASPIGVMLATASPNAVDSDGTSTADIELTITTPDGGALAGDALAYSIKSIDGLGTCGELSDTNGSTDEDGFATITYTASQDDAICGVVAIDAKAGQAATAVVYQGSYADEAPTAEATFPTELGAGSDPSTFDVTFTNPGIEDFTSAEISFDVFPAEGATDDVTADQVSLSASFDGDDGEFDPVELSGSTLGDGSIQGVIDDVELDSGDEVTVTFEIALDESVPVSSEPTMTFEAYLDLVNPASGAGTNLADTLGSDVNVVSADQIPTSPEADGSSSITWLVVTGVVLIAAVGAGTVIARRRRHSSAS